MYTKKIFFRKEYSMTTTTSKTKNSDTEKARTEYNKVIKEFQEYYKIYIEDYHKDRTRYDRSEIKKILKNLEQITLMYPHFIRAYEFYAYLLLINPARCICCLKKNAAPKAFSLCNHILKQTPSSNIATLILKVFMCEELLDCISHKKLRHHLKPFLEDVHYYFNALAKNCPEACSIFHLKVEGEQTYVDIQRMITFVDECKNQKLSQKLHEAFQKDRGR